MAIQTMMILPAIRATREETRDLDILSLTSKNWPKEICELRIGHHRGATNKTKPFQSHFSGSLPGAAKADQVKEPDREGVFDHMAASGLNQDLAIFKDELTELIAEECIFGIREALRLEIGRKFRSRIFVCFRHGADDSTLFPEAISRNRLRRCRPPFRRF